MKGTIFIAGILQFQSRALFQEALDALRAEPQYSPDKSLIPVYESAMVNDTLLVMRHTSHLPAQLYSQVMSEAYLLAEYAGKGYLAGILRDQQTRIQVAMAAMSHPVIDKFEELPDSDIADDYLPRLADHYFEYEYNSEGRSAIVDWDSRTRMFGKYACICFPQGGSDDPFNDWWDGHYFLKSGQKFYSLATDLDPRALSNPAEEEIQLIIDGEGKPGDIHFAYIPGTESFRLYVNEGYEDIDVPYGEFLKCLKVRVDLYFLPTDESRYSGDDKDKHFKKVTTTHYFGKGLGLVKLVFEGGELCLSRVKESSFPDMSAENRSSSSEESSIDEIVQDGSTNGRRRPWWKFW